MSNQVEPNGEEEEEEEKELESEFLQTISVKLRSPRICPEVIVPDERVSLSAAVLSVASCFPLSSFEQKLDHQVKGFRIEILPHHFELHPT